MHRWPTSKKQLTQPVGHPGTSILLMAEIPNNHLRCMKPVVNNGINYQPQLVIAGFQPSTVAYQWVQTHQLGMDVLQDDQC